MKLPERRSCVDAPRPDPGCTTTSTRAHASENPSGHMNRRAAAGSRRRPVPPARACRARVDALELVGAVGAEILSAGRRRDGAQRRFVQVAAARSRSNSEPPRPPMPIVYTRKPRRRQLRCLLRIDHTGGVRTIREQDHDAAAVGILFRAFQREPDRIADRRFLAREANLRFVEQARDGVEIEGERRLQISLSAEQDQPDAIALTPLDELGRDDLRRREAIDAPAARSKSRICMLPEMSTASMRSSAHGKLSEGLPIAGAQRPRARPVTRAPRATTRVRGRRARRSSRRRRNPSTPVLAARPVRAGAGGSRRRASQGNGSSASTQGHSKVIMSPTLRGSPASPAAASARRRR